MKAPDERVLTHRRRLLAALAASCAPLPRLAVAQPVPRRVGVLIHTKTGDADLLGILSEQLGRAGYHEGRNLKLHVESVELDPARHAECARRLLDARPAVVYATTEPLVDALRAQSGATPIVFTSVTDPVARGYVRALSKPGGNLTGVTDRYVEIGMKRLELLREIAPGARRAAFVAGDDDTLGLDAWRATARRLGFDVMEVNPLREDVTLEAALARALARGTDCVFPIGLLRDPKKPGANVLGTFLDFVARNRLPVVYSSTPVVVRRGGLASLEIDSRDALRQGADLVVRVLGGEKPADIPVREPDRFVLALNLRTAREQRIAIPQSVLLRATEVVE